jgi:host cell factor
VGRKIVIHGGWNGSEVFNDLWIFNTDSFVWTQPKTAGIDIFLPFLLCFSVIFIFIFYTLSIYAIITGFGPTPRYGHTLTLTLDGRLLVIGGCSILEDSGLPKYHDDLRCLDTDTMVWSRPRLTGHTLTGRYGHTTSLLEDGKVVVYGGWGKYGCQSKDLIKDENAYSIQILDTKQMIWHIPKKVGSKSLKHLYNHGASKFNDNSIIVFGGYDGRQALNDFYVINFDLENQTN